MSAARVISSRIAAVAVVWPRALWALAGVYFMASLLHFVHNAEYIAFYPGMPVWLTREKVYLAWCAVSAVGAGDILTLFLRWQVLATLLLAAYGALGLDGLGHYLLALCSEHTLVTHLTIAFEALSGLALLLWASVLAYRRS